MSYCVEAVTSPELLKVVVACKFLSKNVSVKKLKNATDFHSFKFTLPSGTELFSSNSAVRYLFQSSNSNAALSSLTLQWMEWEYDCLRDLVIAACASKCSDETSNRLRSCLSRLEQYCKEGTVSRDEVLQCILSASLYPVFHPSSPTQNQWSGSFPALHSWYTQYTKSPHFKVALTEVSEGTCSPKCFGEYFLKIPKTLPEKQNTGNLTNPPSVEKSVEGGEKLSQEELEAAKKSWQVGLNKRNLHERKHPVLPEAGRRNMLITSALPYVNNIPHLGNIIGCVLSADVFSRYCRLRDWNCLYVCGTDEYGTATETKAAQEGVTPQQICDKYNKLHCEVYDWFNIDFDYFGRTSTEQQTKIAQDIFWHLHRNGYLIPQTVEQLYCASCDRFLADRFVEGICPLCAYEDARGDQCDKCGKLINAVELKKPRCKMCNSSPTIKTSEHLFVDLPKLEPKLREHLENSFENQGWSSNAKMITESWLRDGIKPRCITRDLKWGTPVPLEGYQDKVFYVWFDAPIGYISITANYTEQWEKWWKNPEEVELFNFMAKDNVPFHSVVFPCTLLGTSDRYSLVSHLNATEYLNYEDGKFSKSRGVGVFGNHAKETGIDSDIWRFYLLFLRPESQDSAFSWHDFMLKNNSELLNNLGNFINRSLKFTTGSFGGILPKINLTERDVELIALVNREIKEFIADMEKIKLRENLRKILNISRLGNQYFQDNQPWKLVKGSDSEKERAGTVTAIGVNLSCLLSVLLEPFLPATARIIWEQLNAPKTVTSSIPLSFVQMLPEGHKLNTPHPLFRKLEESEMDALQVRFAGKQEEQDVKNKKKKQEVTSSGDANVADFEAKLAKQGNIVREIKANKAEKSVIDKEVSELLRLKKELALIKGEDPEPAKKKKQGKKNKKSK